jgi:hypothetical protein
MKIIDFVKNFKAILSVIITVIVIIIIIGALDYFNKIKFPNIFQRRIVIDNTAIIIDEINDLGEFITVEYYSETYADLIEIYEDLQNEFSKSNKKPDESDFPFFEEYIKNREEYKSLEKRKKIRNFVYTYRGVIQAGFDLSDINGSNFRKENNVLIFSIKKPVLFEHDYSACFLMKEGKCSIPALEIFYTIDKKPAFTNEEDKKVIDKCTAKIKSQSIESGILKKAEENGIKILINFLKSLGFENVQIEFSDTSVG